MLTGREKLAKTSNTPGKTQLINHFKISSRNTEGSEVAQWYLVDLPGFGFAKRSKSTRVQWEEMTGEYIRQRQNLVQLFLLVDSRHTPQKIDLEFAENLYEWQIPYTVIFTKTDKEKQSVIARNVNAFMEAVSGFQQFLPRILLTSAVKRSGRNKLLALIGEMNQDWKEG